MALDRPPRLVAAAIGLALVFADRTTSGSTAARRDHPEKPRVAIAIVVDQLAEWVAEGRLAALPPGGGFDLLLRGGTWSVLEYEHAITETAPGHASLYTRTTPDLHGIIANSVWRADLAKPAEASLIADDRAQRVNRSGPMTDKEGKPLRGISLALLQQDTLGDALLAHDREATIVSLSLKDRGAAFAAPRTRPTDPHATVIWQDSQSGELLTSTAFASSLPSWAVNPSIPSTYRWDADTWLVGRRADSPDAQPGEDESMGGNSFPHVFEQSGGDFVRKLRSTPAGDALLVDLALAATDAVCGAPRADRRCHLSHPYLLALSFSSNDYVGHRFGPDSWEAVQELYRLDQELRRLFLGLDERFGPGGYTVALTADHGVAPLAQLLERNAKTRCGNKGNPFELPCDPSRPGGRLVGKDLETRLNAAMTAPDAERSLHVSDALVFTPPDRKPAVRAALEKLAAGEPGIRSVVDLDSFCVAAPGDPKDRNAAFVRHSVRCEDGKSRWGQLMFVTNPGYFFSDEPYEKVGHGTYYRYDRAVPLLVRAAGATSHQPARGPARGSVSFTAFYDALAKGLGIGAASR